MDPINNQKINVFTKVGRRILKRYIYQYLQKGSGFGMLSTYQEQKRREQERLRQLDIGINKKGLITYGFESGNDENDDTESSDNGDNGDNSDNSDNSDNGDNGDNGESDINDIEFDFDNDNVNDNNNNSDPKLYVIGCLNEILVFDEPENKVGRAKTIKDKVKHVQCTYSQIKKDKLKDKNCHQDENLVFVSHDNKCLDFETPLIDRNDKIKKKLRTNIWQNILGKIGELEAKNVVMVSHHNLIKKVLLPFSDKTYGLANCSCIKIIINKGQVTLKLVFSGFPDKIDHYNYIQNNETLMDVVNYGLEKGLKNVVSSFSNLNTTIYLVRHGNAMHNKPIGEIYGVFNPKPFDSSLTPMGVFQAYIFGQHLQPELQNEKVFYFCSNLRRTQETVMTIREQIEGDKYPDSLKQFNAKMREHGVLRILRDMKNKSFDKMIELLVTDKEKIEQKLKDKINYNKLPEKYGTEQFKEYISNQYPNQINN